MAERLIFAVSGHEVTELIARLISPLSLFERLNKVISIKG